MNLHGIALRFGYPHGDVPMMTEDVFYRLRPGTEDEEDDDELYGDLEEVWIEGPAQQPVTRALWSNGGERFVLHCAEYNNTTDQRRIAGGQIENVVGYLPTSWYLYYSHILNERLPVEDYSRFAVHEG